MMVMSKERRKRDRDRDRGKIACRERKVLALLEIGIHK